jgi:signal transduction histidine kinase
MSTAAKRMIRAVTKANASAPDNSLRPMIDACVSNVAVLDESGSIMYASNAWCLLEHANNAHPRRSETTLSYFESCRRVTESEFEGNITLADDIQDILFGNEKEFHRQYYRQSFGEQRAFVMHAARLNLPGSTFRVLITREELPFAREEFRDSKERLIELLGTKILSWEGEVEGPRFTYVSEHAIGVLGYPAAAWYEPDFLMSHVHADDLEWVLAAYEEQTRIRDHFDLTFRMWAIDGRLVWVQNLISVGSRSEVNTKINGFMIDVSERKRTEESLKDLGGRLIAAQEEERRRVARDLHDDFNQRLALLSLELEQLGKQIQPLGVRHNVEHLQALAREIATDIHRLSHKLHPSKLEHLGLASAIRSLCTELTESGKIRVEFHQSGFPSALDSDVTLGLYRIAQEGLRNCVKHSGAQSARVVLMKTANAVRLTVSDNGCGFNTKSDLMEKGLGFISMKERLHVLGGEMSVSSRRLRGTRIEAWVPLRTKPDLPQESNLITFMR